MSLEPNGYRPRLLDTLIDRRLQGFGAVEIVGTKFCGKTWTSMKHGESITHIDDADIKSMVQLDPNLALDGTIPHIIDEWQEIPQIWDSVRRKIDETGNQKGQFILTGSSTVDKTQVTHSGAGRIANVHLRPMSLFESGDSDGSVSLQGLFEGDFTAHQVNVDIRRLAALICLGGWPASLELSSELASDLPAQYLNALFSASAPSVGLDQYMARRVARSLARNIGKSVKYKTIYADVSEGEQISDMNNAISQQKLAPYINFFKNQYFIEDQNGWDAPVKSRSRIRTKPKRSFVDPSLPASLLGMSPECLLHETQVFGNLFEELCLRDVRIYASTMNQFPEPSLYYYSDADGLEVDMIIELADGRWAALEVKLSEAKVDEAEKNLLRLKNKVAANPKAHNKQPVFLAVLVGKANFCHQTSKGTYVIPITSLTA